MRRRQLNLLFGLAATFLTVACGGGSSGDSASMPALESKRLDVALSDLKAQGIEEGSVEVLGGGAFGVIDESNWTVCSQEPATGAIPGDKIRLTVDRSCVDQDAAEGPAEPAESQEAKVESAGPESAKPESAKPERLDTFTMPNLVGTVLQDAQDELQDRGSHLMQQVDATGMHRPKLLDSNWRVCAQTPEPGSKTPIETIVRLDAVKLNEKCP